MKIDLKIPKQNASDNEVKITEIFFNNGEFVKKDEIIIEYDTSKATFDFEAPKSGYFYHNLSLNDSIEIQTVFGVISEKVLNNDEFDFLFENKRNDLIKDNKIISKQAEELIKKHSINVFDIDEEIITEDIVLEYIRNKNKPIINYSKLLFNKNDIVIVGIGGHARMCIDIIKSQNKYNLVGFIDKYIFEDNIFNLPYLGNLEDIDNLISSGLKNLIMGIGFHGNLKKRNEYFDNYIQRINVPTIIHNSAIIEKSAKIGRGSQIMAGAIIGSNVIIDENCIINSGAIISHDSYISKSSHITPGAILAGGVKIGERCTIGMGSTIYIGSKIDNDTIINNGENIY